MEPHAIELRFLGVTRIVASGVADQAALPPKRLALLAYLALETADGFRRRDQIVGLFWPELDQENARTQLRKSLSALRTMLGPESVETRGENEVRIDPDRVWCDAVALQVHVRDRQWPQALELYRGELLQGLFVSEVSPAFEEWLAESRRQLSLQAARAASECARIEEERGDLPAAIGAARRVLELSPDDEDAVRRLMALLDRLGDRGGALSVYRRWQDRLRVEYEAPPAPETRRLARRIQSERKGESLETTPTPTVALASSVSSALPMRRRRGFGFLWLGLSVAVIATFAGAVYVRPAQPAEDRSVALLPFHVIGDPAGTGVFADELSTALIADSAVRVRVTFSAPHDGEDVAAIARRLGVAYVLNGSVQHSGLRMRVSLRLLRADGLGVWASAYDLDAPSAPDAPAIARSAAEAIREHMKP